jgi:hypothetical protein
MQEANQDDVMSILSLASAAGHSPEIAHDSNQSSTMAAISKIVFEEDEADDSDYEIVTDAFEPPSEAAAAAAIVPPPPVVVVAIEESSSSSSQEKHPQNPPKEKAKRNRKRLRGDSRLIVENTIAASEEASRDSNGNEEEEEAREEEGSEELPPRPSPSATTVVEETSSGATASKSSVKPANKSGRTRKRRRIDDEVSAIASVPAANAQTSTFETDLYPTAAVNTLDQFDIEKIILRAANDPTVEKYHIKFTEERSGEARALPIPVHLTF